MKKGSRSPNGRIVKRITGRHDVFAAIDMTHAKFVHMYGHGVLDSDDIDHYKLVGHPLHHLVKRKRVREARG